MYTNAHSQHESDHETRLAEDDHHSIKLWLRLLTCTNLIESKLRTALREEFDTTLPRFDFMAQLEREPDGIIMGELSKRMMVSGGNVSGIASQLVNEGLIKRSSLPEDRRTYNVKLTPKGLRHFYAMAERHEEWVISMLGNLPQEDVDHAMRLLGTVKQMAGAAKL